MKNSTVSLVILISAIFASPFVSAQSGSFSTVVEERSYADPPTGDFVSNGVITPLDQEMRNFYIRNADGVIEVQLADDALIGLQSRVDKGVFEAHKVVFSMGKKTFAYDLPELLYVKRTFKDAAAVKDWLEGGSKPLMDGKLYVGPLEDHLPTAEEPWLSGKFLKENGRFMDVQIEGEVFQIGTQGDYGQHRIMGLLSQKDIAPFVQQAFVHGRMEGSVFVASEVALRMLEDAKAQDDPKLGRYLFIGDSISGNYDKALRAALKGKLNLYHPPTNCGTVSKGVENIVQWLGPYEEAGHGWDVISFNFGHWDSGSTQETFQADLERVVAELERTGAKLIFVTTTPIPGGYPEPGELDAQGKAPGRVQGTMKRFINPWALEVMARHPDIAICDQHALISSEKFYAHWLATAGTREAGEKNEVGDLHIGGLLAEPAGRQLARRVLDVLGRESEALNPHGLSDSELDSTRQRPATQGLDGEDLVDLLSNDSRMRAYNP